MSVRPNLNWFSPLPPASSAIAVYTAQLLPYLAERATVTLWTAHRDWDANLERYADVRWYDPGQMPWNIVNRADATIFHIGNNSVFHGDIVDVCRLHPGIVVMHDLRLHNLALDLFLLRWGNEQGYLSAMGRFYGRVGRLDAELFLSQRVPMQYLAQRYPLTRFFLEKAVGAIVHTPDAYMDVRQAGMPVTYAPLPYRDAPHAPRGVASRPPWWNAPPYRLVLFGYLGWNRRVNTIVQALAQMPERDQFRIDLYGEIQDLDSVRRMVETLNLSDLVTIHGFVPDIELRAALAAAHLAINLRYPSMGEASFSQLQIWSHALPTLVTPVGWFETLPEDVVAFVRPDHDIEDIQGHLRALLANPYHFARMGARGRQFLEARHTPELYVRAITDFVARHDGFQVQAIASHLADRAGAEMGAWLSELLPKESIANVARQIAAMTQ